MAPPAPAKPLSPSRARRSQAREVFSSDSTLRSGRSLPHLSAAASHARRVYGATLRPRGATHKLTGSPGPRSPGPVAFAAVLRMHRAPRASQLSLAEDTDQRGSGPTQAEPRCRFEARAALSLSGLAVAKVFGRPTV